MIIHSNYLQFMMVELILCRESWKFPEFCWGNLRKIRKPLMEALTAACTGGNYFVIVIWLPSWVYV